MSDDSTPLAELAERIVAELAGAPLKRCIFTKCNHIAAYQYAHLGYACVCCYNLGRMAWSKWYDCEGREL